MYIPSIHFTKNVSTFSWSTPFQSSIYLAIPEVVGAGSGGLTAAKVSARFGAKVLLVERLARLGGDCTWFGCVPSKVPGDLGGDI